MDSAMEDNTVSAIRSVVSADDMSNSDFAKHMMLRHGQSLGRVRLPEAGDAVTPAWRAFHRRVHQLAAPGQLNHVHSSVTGE